MTRSWWVFLLYGLMAIVFGLFALFQPQATMRVVMLAVGLLALGDGLVSLLTVFRKGTALPAWLLLVYAAISIGFGLLLLFQTQAVATFVIWLLAVRTACHGSKPSSGDAWRSMKSLKQSVIG